MKAVICGAGIAGLALAQRLRTLDWDVVVVEKAPGPRPQGYMIDFFGPGYDAAERMGVLPRVAELGYRVDGLSYLDDSGRRRAGMDYASLQRAVDGRLLSIMRPDLERALREQVDDDVDLRFGSTIARIDDDTDGVRVALDDGTVIDADVLVGADGIHSTVRERVFGPEQRYFRYLGFHTAAYTFDDPEVYESLGNRFCLTDTVDRQLGFYGLRDGRVAVFAVHRSSDPTLPDDAREAVRAEHSTLGWMAPRALAACPESSEIYYDQVAQVEVPRWSRGRVVLLGDACQAVSLLAGQGASLAIAGAYVLGEQLATADSVEDALTEYQRLWQPVATEKQRVGRNGAKWFLPPSTARLWARRIAFKLAGLPGLDKYFATALVGETPVPAEELDGRRAAPR
ncbi:2-polyprenyl-6-methoxyphenol hydroxylase-like FAD-dependent oxidoreductase [Saccharopolyspora lacisalsi]|uniref:2-polyprenyl-6-methoxyphenol hydroxylase-like FAD-dependent oxidoreductase n=1 Tax=Halosaccharopolyspora lacisalsi TaxID=1000566 RepID=A0A839DPS4_9PSEU|nr:FAD-dependent monooxygenase [Halosaccharopolyspora lacisalsi]MBA8822739.1 2-polyprenyl-6-methoxyphenol hydroxylase-like FAD-dependent oxidoreductase [Halosaccharopolyspora lacisalsi]